MEKWILDKGRSHITSLNFSRYTKNSATSAIQLVFNPHLSAVSAFRVPDPSLKSTNYICSKKVQFVEITQKSSFFEKISARAATKWLHAEKKIFQKTLTSIFVWDFIVQPCLFTLFLLHWHSLYNSQ